ncbi:MAG: hypothetical protein HC912_12160 [Saprospiraceae bacterium]|nr:hypothetical protein [Saprospiraceae bacterium]
MKAILRFCLLLPILSSFAWAALAQQDIYLSNTSFEGQPDDATIPVGWFACTPSTTPDILPGPWGVYQEATEGDTYMGLITRGDGTFESIGQRLPKAIKAKECYKFSLDLAHSDTYAGYSEPIKLRIWLGQQKCEKGNSLRKLISFNTLILKPINLSSTPKKSGTTLL